MIQRIAMHPLGHDDKSGRLRPQRGFTLIEMMITLAVMAVLLAIAAPSFNSALLGSKLGAYANSLIASTLLARSEAIKRNAAVTLCASTNGTTCATAGGWEQGWVVLAGATLIQRQQAVGTGFRVTGLDPTNTVIRTLTFQPTGVGATQATMTICQATPSAGGQERVVSISATGRASSAKTTNGVCT